jgi:S1-C subfamily serine protease
MFSKAYEIASEYTRPLIISHRLYDGKVQSGLGSFIVINKEGWILTAAHLIEPVNTFNQHVKAIKEFNKGKMAIDQHPNLSVNAKLQKKQELQPNPRWMTNLSHWWGNDKHKIRQFKIFKENDIAIGRIEDYDPSFCKQYPVFKDPSKMKIGTSVCKLGFPFFNVKTTFNKQVKAFQFDRSILPIPRFPIDGIITRYNYSGKSKVINLDIRFVETSSPGLRGQSGGPLFDVEGRVMGIQSHTRHLPLGFSPKIKKGEEEVEEHQFLNVGVGAHVQSILAFLDMQGVKYNVG